MRVLILDNAPFVGGAQVNLRHLSRLFVDRGCEVCFGISATCHPTALADYQGTGLPVFRVPMGQSTATDHGVSAKVFASGLAALRTVARTQQVDVVFASSRRTGALAGALRLLTGTKTVWRLCDMGVPRSRKALTLFVNRAGCVSQAVYRSYSGLPRRHFRIVPTGVWAPDTEPAQVASRREAIRRELRIPNGAPVVGAVCNFQYWKGLHLVLESFRLVLDRVPSAYLVHIGGPVPGYEDYPARIDEMVKTLGLVDRVRLLGYRSSALPYYAAFDVFAHLPVPEHDVTDPEAFGQVAAEALAYRIPVVLARLGGLPEIASSDCGILVAPDSASEAARALTLLLEDRRLLSALSGKAHERYRRLFTIEREADDYLEIFSELVGVTSPRHGTNHAN